MPTGLFIFLSVPYHICAEKRMRRDAKKKIINRMRVGLLRACVKNFEEVAAKSEKTAIASAFVRAQSQLMQSGRKGAIHPRTAARKISRLALRMNRA